MADLLTIILFVYGSIFFCWAVAAMATEGKKPVTWKVSNPRAQIKVALTAFAALFAVSILYKFILRDILPITTDTADTIFSGVMIICAIAAAAAFRENPGSIGLSFKNIHVTLLFLLPPVAAVFLPGGIINWKHLLKDFSIFFLAAGFAEELFLRGYLLPRLQAALGFLPGLLSCALLIVIFRVPVLMGTSPLSIAIACAGDFIIWGVVASLIYARVGNIYGLVILRVFWNVAMLALAGFTIE